MIGVNADLRIVTDGEDIYLVSKYSRTLVGTMVEGKVHYFYSPIRVESDGVMLFRENVK